MSFLVNPTVQIKVEAGDSNDVHIVLKGRYHDQRQRATSAAGHAPPHQADGNTNTFVRFKFLKPFHLGLECGGLRDSRRT